MTMTAMTAHVIGIDLGGTHCRAGIVDAHGYCGSIELQAVESVRTPAAIVALMARLVEALRAEGTHLGAVGVGAPGLVSMAEGRVVQSPHFPEWSDVPLRDLLAERTGLPVTLENDANAIAVGEGWQGAARDWREFVTITLGTGIGGGIVMNGEPVRAESGFAGEIGHLAIAEDGPPCPCGSRGCWERYASASGLAHCIRTTPEVHFAEDPGRITPERLSTLAADGDPSALRVWERFGTYLGIGMASLVNILGIERLVIGGGLHRAWKFFRDAALTTLSQRSYLVRRGRIQVRPSELGERAGILGAARLALAAVARGDT
ncbi:MAG: ROK family protein [Deltaproteobacteria bacterium]|nr:ROK family protein [Deltaproteobacteria bacterium]